MSQNDQLANCKKDIYSQVYDSNLSINTKFQMINESLVEKFDEIDRMINKLSQLHKDDIEKVNTVLEDMFDF